MRPAVVLALVCGAALGLGVALLIRFLVPSPPPLGPALERLRPRRGAVEQPPGGWADSLLARIRVPSRELRLLGQSPQRYALNKLAAVTLGLVFPSVFSLILAVSGLYLGMVFPAAAGVGLAALLWFLVDVSVRQRAAEAREEFSRAVSVYLELVALELAAAHGPSEALERAASVGGGWVSRRISDALHAARLRLETPWDALKRVADDIGVPELGDVGDIMTLAGDQGAQVYDTLRSRARSLRAAILAREEERANTATTVLYIPTSLLVFVLFAIAAYPFLIRLITV